jgi:integrase/recombinase XerD
MSELNVDYWQARYREALSIRRYAPRTVEVYVTEVRPFFAYLSAQGVAALGSLTPTLMDGYRTELFYREHRGKRLSFRTQDVRLSAVKGFTRFLYRDKVLSFDPGAAVERPRVEKTLPRTLLSEASVAHLLEAPDVTDVCGLRDRTIIEVLYATAIRNSELCGVGLDALHLDTGELAVRQAKGRKARLVPLGDTAVHWVTRYLEESRPHLVSNPKHTTLFLTMYGAPFNRQSLALLVIRLARRAGLEQRITPHALRHACATHMLARGAGLRHLQELLGHATVSTTQRYTRLDISDLKAVHRRFHPREQTGTGPVPSVSEEMP